VVRARLSRPRGSHGGRCNGDGSEREGLCERWLRGKIAYDIRFELFNGRELQGIYDFTLQRGPHWRRIARGYSILVLDPVQQRGVLDFYRHRLHAEPLYRDRDVAVVKLPTGAAP
jgi:hypothetical protein